MENILVYEAESERASFEKFVENNRERYESLKGDANPFIPESFNERTRTAFENQLRTTYALK